MTCVRPLNRPTTAALLIALLGAALGCADHDKSAATKLADQPAAPEPAESATTDARLDPELARIFRHQDQQLAIVQIDDPLASHRLQARRLDRQILGAARIADLHDRKLRIGEQLEARTTTALRLGYEYPSFALMTVWLTEPQLEALAQLDGVEAISADTSVEANTAWSPLGSGRIVSVQSVS